MKTHSKVSYQIVGPDEDPVVWHDHIGGKPVVFKQAKNCARVMKAMVDNWKSASWQVLVTNTETHQECLVIDFFDFELDDIFTALVIAKERVGA